MTDAAKAPAKTRGPRGRRRARDLAASSLCLALIAGPAMAAGDGGPAAPTDLAGLLLPPISASDMTVGGRDYAVFVTRPPGPAPAAGFPVLVVLDANANFATAASAAWIRSAYADIAPIMVVGIGYPTRDPRQVQARRSLDFTSPGAGDSGSPYLAGQATGGAEAFRGVVAAVLRKVEAEAPVDPRCRVLFGHSLAGLFVVDTLLRRPDMFEGYFAASPSLWANGSEIFGRIPPRADWDRLKSPVRVRLEVGALEARISERQLRAFPEYRHSPDARMVANLERMAAALTAVGSPRLQVGSAVLPGESHLSEAPRVIGEAVTFASECPAAAEAR